MNLPQIFCPDCDSLILSVDSCPDCAWVREAYHDLDMGTIIWQKIVDGVVGTPFVIGAVDRQHLYIVAEDINLTSIIYALKRHSGEVGWSFTLPEGRIAHHLILADGRLFVPPEDSRILGEDQTEMIALNSATGEIVWQCALPCHSVAPPQVLGDSIFLTGSNQGGFLISGQDGAVQKIFSGLPAWKAIQPCFHQDHLFVSGRSNQIMRLSPTKKWESALLFAHKSQDRWFNKGVVGYKEFILAPGDDGTLYAIHYLTGEVMWEADLERGASSPAVVGDLLYIGIKRLRTAREKYGVAAIDLSNGRQVWFYPTQKHVEIPPVVVDNRLYVASRDGRLAAVDATNGRELWGVLLADIPRFVPVVEGQALFIGVRGGRFFSIACSESNSGKLGLAEAEYYRQEKAWMAAGTAAALQSEWVAAAADFERAGQSIYQGQMLAQASEWWLAFKAFMVGKDMTRAREVLLKIENQELVARVLFKLKDYQEAAVRFAKLELWEQAAEGYEKAGMRTQALDAYIKSGNKNKVAELYLKLGNASEAARILPDPAAYKAAASQHLPEESVGGKLYLSLLDQTIDPALKLAISQKNWADARHIAFDRAHFELEAEACLQLAALAIDDAKYDHFMAAGQAFIRTARKEERALKEKGSLTIKQLDRLADIWEKAAKAFKQGLAPKDVLAQCHHEIGRLRRWPDLKIEVTTVRELVAGEYNKLKVVVRNIGLGTARNIELRVIEDLFDGDLDQTQVLPGLRPNQSIELLLRIIPKENSIGWAVPLDLELIYQRPNNTEFSRRIQGQVPVQRPDSAYRTPASQSNRVGEPRPDINIYQDKIRDLARPHAFSSPPELREKMTDYFSLSELETACFDLDLDFELLEGQNKQDKIRELIIYCEKRQMITELLDICADVYPHVDWQEEEVPS